MDTAIDNAIEILAKKVKSDMEQDAALKFTQAALNLAHVKATLHNIKNPQK